MKKLLVLLVLLVSGLGYSQRNTDTTTLNPMFYGLNTDRSITDGYDFEKFKILNDWYKENVHLVYEEFIRLVNEERSHLTVDKHFIIYLNQTDYEWTHKGFKDSGDSVLFIPNKKEAKKLSKQIQEEYNVVDVHTQKIRLGNYVADRIRIKYIMPVEKIKFDSLTSLASLHHNKFFINESNYWIKDWKTNPLRGYIFGHHEVSEYYPYHDTVIVFASDRVKYFTNNTRVDYGEIVCTTMCLGIRYPVFKFELNPTTLKNNPYKKWAENLFNQFKESPKHHEAILTKHNIDMVGMNLLLDCSGMGYFTVNFVKENK
jgi:hypothetical protein